MINYATNINPGFGFFSIKSLVALTNIRAPILWVIFGLVALVTLLVSFVLHYHWLRYGLGDAGVLLAQILYTLVTLVVLIIMIGSIFYYGSL